MRLFMAIKPMNKEEYAMLNDEEMVRVVWEWGMSKEVIDSQS